VSDLSPAGAPTDDAAEIARAREIFARQRAARWRVGEAGPRERAAKLKRLRRAVLAHREAVHAALRADFGKAPLETEVTEIVPTLQELAHAIRYVRRWMRPRRVGTPAALFGTRSEVRPVPRGVALILGPFNYPFGLVVKPLIAAVAAGNCAVVRGSEKTPATTAVLASILADAFPDDEVALVSGGVPVAEALLELPFDHVFFTGSAAVGRRVMRAAAGHLASVTLELGGKSPAVVDETADVEYAARHIAWGKYVNAGQTCIAPDYVLAHEAVAGLLAEALAAAVAAAYGDTAEARAHTPDLARLIDPAAYDRVRGLVDDAVAGGARVVTGGECAAEERYLAPTVLAGVRPDSRVMREEIFGPVLPVATFRTLDEAIERLRAAPHPLALYVFSRSDENVERLLRGTTSGGVVVNDVLIHFGNPSLPFGGVGESGFGAYHGEAGFRAFSHARSILRQGPLALSRFLHPPYGPRTARVLGLMERMFR
jgi:aldehyde dehydrogenase (NAD+)